MESKNNKKNIGYVLTDGKNFFGKNNIIVSTIREANIYNDKFHADDELKIEISLKNDDVFRSYVEWIRTFYPLSVFVEKLGDSEVLNALENLLGVLDTPIGRRKINNEFSKESIKIAKEILQKYKVD